MPGDILGHLIEHTIEFAALDPAVQAAVGVARDKVDEMLESTRAKAIKRVVEIAAKKLFGKEKVIPPLTVTVPILESARDETREELVELWASLLAAACDAKRCTRYRREFVEIAKRLEPIDAAALRILDTHAGLEPTRRQFIAIRLQVAEDEVELAFRALERLELVRPFRDGLNMKDNPQLSALGRQFLLAVQ